MGIADEKLGDYIKRHLEKGFSLNDINNKLIDSGYSKEKVNDAISGFKSEQREKGFPIKKIIIAILIIAVATGAVFLLLSGRGGVSEVSEEFEEEFEEGLPYEERLEMACDHFSKISKFYCIGVITGNSTYCDMVIKRGNTTIPYVNVSITTEGTLNKESCLNEIKLAGEEGYYNNGILSCPSEEEIRERQFVVIESETKNMLIMCNALKDSDPSLCEGLYYESYNQVLKCKALASRDTKYCEEIYEMKNCEINEEAQNVFGTID